MSVKSQVFFQKMLEFLPSAYGSYEESVNRFGEVLETVVIEDIFMPEIIKLLKNEDNAGLLNNIFAYFEEICSSQDEHLINIFSVTILEILGDDKELLERAQKYIRPNTQQLLIETIENM